MRKTLSLLAAGAVFAMFAPNASAQERDDSFKWSGGIEAGRTVYVRNLNGSINVESAAGATAEVRAEKEWRRGDPKDVKITAAKTANGDILVCAIWEGRETRCDEDGYSSRGGGRSWNDRNDVSVKFTILLPKGVKLDASTVNGGLGIAGATAAVKARTVNGGIDASTTGGPVSAKTVNGGIRVRAGSIGTGPVEYETVNGSVTLELPESLNADIEMHTVNGSITSEDFPILVQGRIDRRRIEGKIGKGGPELSVSTVNGSIRLRKN
ncbi:MAG TPA: DUF4097 family beta strand repeat-containing protein [Gemmatimonadaceae bacterium]|jgi:hypothetical protein